MFSIRASHKLCGCNCQILRRTLNLPKNKEELTQRSSFSTTSSHSSNPPVLEQVHGDIALVGLNRPRVRNCVDIATATALKEALKRAQDDAGLKSIVLHGVGGNFCAGYDLKEVANNEQNGKTLEEFFVQEWERDPSFRPMGPSMWFINKPLIGAISGYAVAGGLELALLCDVRFADDDAVLGVFCRRFGVPLLDGGTVRLGAIAGYSRAMELILTGRPIKAEEALSIGLISGIVESGTALGRALSFARSLSKFPQSTMLADRRSLFNATFNANSFQEAFQFELREGLPVFGEAVKGAKQFTEGVGRGASFDLHGLKGMHKNN